MADKSASTITPTTTSSITITNKTPYVPSELLQQICRSLGKKDLKSFRLASRRFNECAEHYLITNATVAARFGTLNALTRIVNHPVFSKTITKITVDASHFEYPLTTKTAYLNNFLDMIEHDNFRERDRIVCRAIEVEQQGLAERLGNEEFFPSFASVNKPSNRWSEFRLDPNLINNPSKADSSAASGLNLLSRGYIKYCQLYSDQKKIRTRGLFHSRLENALRQLPNVTSLEIGDDPRDGPLVVDIGEELMGYCQDPSKWDIIGIDAPLSILPLTIISLCTTPTNLSSFSLSCSDLWPRAWAYDPYTGRFPRGNRLCASNLKVLSDVFRSLKSLELRLHAYNGHLNAIQRTRKVRGKNHRLWSSLRSTMCRLDLENGQVAQIIGTAINIEHLRLDFGSPIPDWSPQKQQRHPDVHLDFLLGNNVWKHLASLEIIGLGLYPHEMGKFLAPQKALKRIELIQVGVQGKRWCDAVRVLNHLGLEHIKIRKPWGLHINPSRTWTDEDPWILLVENWILHGTQGDTQPFLLM